MSPGPVVLKFGGTSVGDAEAIGRLVRHVSAAHRAARGAVVVVSALSGVTDRLFAPRGGGRRGDRRTADARRASPSSSSGTSTVARLIVARRRGAVSR